MTPAQEQQAWEAMHGSPEVCKAFGEDHRFIGDVVYENGKPMVVRVCRCGQYKCMRQDCTNGVSEAGYICGDHDTCSERGCLRIPMVGCDFCDLHNE